jgi:hypothetical protein
MATMGKYVVAYELAIKTVCSSSLGEQALISRIGGTRAKSRDPSSNRPLTSVSSVPPCPYRADSTGDLSRYIGGDIDIDSVS